MHLTTAPISSRNQFGILLTDLGLTGRAVEVGTHRGDFAAQLLRTWPGTLHCIDPWTVPPGYEVQAEKLLHIGGHGDREDDYRAARDRLAKFDGRAVLMRRTSTEAAPRFADGSLDFVYLDGDHRRAHVEVDLEIWWPKLRPGGLLAGHDLVCPGEADGGWGRQIQPAVWRFANGLGGADVYLVVEEETGPWSYYLEKP